MPWGRSALLVAIALLVCLPAGAAADTYTVTRSDDPAPSGCLPADCSLREALEAANATTTVDDVVIVPASATPYAVETKWLEIEDEAEVLGAGAGQAIVQGDGNSAVVEVGAPVVLSGLTITGGEGGIQNNGELTLVRVSVENNTATAAGGGIQSNGPLTIESSFIGFNRGGGGAGGGIQANEDLTVVNSTIAGNLSEGNGGINGNAPVTVINSAVVGNRSSGATGLGVKGSPLTVKDSVFADNRNTAGLANCFSLTGVSSFGGNVEDGASCAVGPADRPNVAPLLGPLGLHGGTTPVYELLPGSPAIDFAGACPPFDQRGVARPQGAGCDSGSYEFVPGPPAGDHELAMAVGKGKLPLSRRNRVRVRLTCPSTEVSPPCEGRVVLSIEIPPRPSRNGLPPLMMVRRAGFKKSFSIGAGQTQGVRVRLSRRAAENLRTSRKVRKAVVLKLVAEDAAGNRQSVKQRRSIVPR